MPANLRLGVRKSGTSLEAHACVELYGVVLHDDIYQDFFPFDQDIATRISGLPKVEDVSGDTFPRRVFDRPVRQASTANPGR